jgi:hypothetical protein
LSFGAETKTVLSTFARSAEQFLAVGGFVWNLIYDVSVGMAIILRSLSNQVLFNSNFSVAISIGFFFMAIIFLSRLKTRSNRPSN